MNWYEHVDHYCERGSQAIWAEPVNALSNLSFIVAAWAIWRLLSLHPRSPRSIAFMAPLATLIGVGSFAFHTLATRWAQVLDVAPIGLFVLCYLASYLRWFYGLAWRRCLLGVAAFIGCGAVFIVLVGSYVPNRSGTYVPVLLLIVGLTAVLRSSRDSGRVRHWKEMLTAALVFAAALLSRTVDHQVCGAFSLGTHFLWHTFDGVLIYLASRALVGRWRSVTEPTAREDTRAVAVPDQRVSP
ncbi:ceramidase domain-containing protein [Streptomyces sp. NPDC056486]|uniref:ceramidase domain-containing protein n=1 Tax=Streptomyces sp. NPDC056486 TaxID=3345835 RepID=UPI0036B0D004